MDFFFTLLLPYPGEEIRLDVTIKPFKPRFEFILILLYVYHNVHFLKGLAVCVYWSRLQFFVIVTVD